jgi:hypothetical protein
VDFADHTKKLEIHSPYRQNFFQGCASLSCASKHFCFAADPGARFITTSFMGLMMDICIMQPGRVFMVAFITVMIVAYTYNTLMTRTRIYVLTEQHLLCMDVCARTY